MAVAAGNPLAWLMKGPGRERPGEPGWSDTQKHEVTAGTPTGEPLNFKLVINAPPCPVEHELFDACPPRSAPSSG